jgi:hypothetical protein
MQRPPLDQDVADTAPPSDSLLTVYDEEHIITCLRMLDANAVGADWKDIAGIVLHLDPDRDPIALGRRSTAICRARWMTEHGYQHLLRGGASAQGDFPSGA